jgi:hypothetical protein
MDEEPLVPFLKAAKGNSLEDLGLAFFALCQEIKSDRTLLCVALNALAKQQSCDRPKFHADFIETAARLHHGADRIPPHWMDVAWAILGDERLKEN